MDPCRTLGYDNMIPPSEEIAAVGNEAAKDMPVWPVAGSVKEVDGIIVVRLS